MNQKLLIRGVIMVILLLPCMASTVSASGVQDALEAEQEALELDELERAAQEYLDGTDIAIDNDWEENLSQLLDTGSGQIKSVVKRAVRSGVLLLIIVTLCSVGDGLTLAGKEMKVPVVTLAGTLAVTAVAVTDIYSLMGLGTEAISSMTDFSNVLLPIVAAVTAATGAITGASARQMAAALFSSLLVNLISKLLIPLVYGYIAAQVAYAAVGNAGLKRVAGFFKWLTVTILTVILLVYVGYLTMSGVVTGSADGATVKAAKFAISGAVPVVGGILADASESVLAAAGILRGTVGVFGMIVVLAICLIPFLQLGIHYLIYKLASALAATVGEGRVCGLIEDLGGAFGMILGMMGACALLLLVSLVSSITVVVT
jgi:stage III sporulation protein AE